jgi:antitoxin PrlF
MEDMDQVTLHVDNQGRLMLPSWWRKKMGVRPSTQLCAVVTQEGALILETRDQGLRRAQALVRKYIPEGATLSDELIVDRRAEAARDAKKAR